MQIIRSFTVQHDSGDVDLNITFEYRDDMLIITQGKDTIEISLEDSFILESIIENLNSIIDD